MKYNVMMASDANYLPYVEISRNHTEIFINAQ